MDFPFLLGESTDHTYWYVVGGVVVVIAFLLFWLLKTKPWTRFRAKYGDAEVEISNDTGSGTNSTATASDGGIAQSGTGNIIQVGAADAETLNKIVNRYESDLTDRDQQIQQLQAALDRVRQEAVAGDEQAKAAIASARNSGDVGELQRALVALADRKGEDITARMGDYVELCREIAAVAYLRGDIDEAEKRIQVILRADPDDLNAINQFGRIHKLRGDLPAAEGEFRRLLEIAPNDHEARAVALGNLGLIELTRGNLDAAEKLHRESLEIERKLGRLEGQASQLGNLGLIELTRGNLDAAEKLHRESLEINRKLGRLEGQASDLGNLGSVAQLRGDLKQARELWEQAKDLFARIGMPQMVEKVQGWIDQLGDR